MALDDVVHSCTDDDARFTEATHRTVRWLDRCIAAHSRKDEQNLFAIVQGGLDVTPGGLRDQCVAAFLECGIPSGHCGVYGIGCRYVRLCVSFTHRPVWHGNGSLGIVEVKK